MNLFISNLKISALVMAVAIAFLPGFARARGGDQEGNGGAGLSVEGRYMTFYSAGLYAEPQPQQNTDVPSLEKLRLFVKSFAYWSEGTRAKLLAGVIPSDSHLYYKVQDNRFDETTRARILAEYGRVTHQPPESLHIFAVTDANSGTTFLLPAFYQLTDTEQMTILFHETLWILLKDLDYNHVISAEMAFQAVVTQPENLNRIADLLKNYGTNNDRLQFAITADLKRNALKGFLVNNQVSIGKLFSIDWFRCYAAEEDKTSCLRLITPSVYELTQKYPNSFFLKLVYEQLTQRDGPQLDVEPKFEESKIVDGQQRNYALHAITSATLNFKLDRWAALSSDNAPLRGEWSGTFDANGSFEDPVEEDGGGVFILNLFGSK